VRRAKFIYLGSDDREVGVAPQRQGTPLAKARNDLIDRPSGNPFNEQEILLWDGTNFVQDVVAPPLSTTSTRQSSRLILNKIRLRRGHERL
jgi:hypothetical protein